MASVLAGMDLVGLSAADELVVHGGDMARATGQHYQCQPELLDAANRFLVQFASPRPACRAGGAVRAIPGGSR